MTNSALELRMLKIYLILRLNSSHFGILIIPRSGDLVISQHRVYGGGGLVADCGSSTSPALPSAKAMLQRPGCGGGESLEGGGQISDLGSRPAPGFCAISTLLSTRGQSLESSNSDASHDQNSQRQRSGKKIIMNASVT